MDIKQIVDKIVREADLNPSEYTVAHRIEDVNSAYLKYIEWATQIGSTEAVSNKEVHTEILALVDGDNTLNRTITDVPFYSIEYTSDLTITADSHFSTLSFDGRHYCGCGLEVELTEKQIILENAHAGNLRIRYARGSVVLFTEADYSLPTPPTPTWIPVEFRDLLWLEPAATQAEYYKKDRAVPLRNKQTKLEQLFYNHYNRNATQEGVVKTRWGNYR